MHDDHTLISNGIFRIASGPVNWYIVEQRGDLTLIDAGLRRNWPTLLRVVGSIGRDVSNVRAVVLTHSHADHVGFAEQVRRASGARIFVHRAEATRVRRPIPALRDAWVLSHQILNLRQREFRAVMRYFLVHGHLWPQPVREMTTFGHGDVLDIPGQPRVLHVPGHTRGSSALLLDESGVIFTGDALVTHDPDTGLRGPRLLSRPANDDSCMAQESLSALERQSAMVVLPGHGEPWTQGIASAVRLARDAATR